MNIGKRKKFFVLALSMILMLVVRTNAFGDVAINEANFPDENLRNYVSGFDSDGDGILSDAEIAAVTHFEPVGKNISSLKGMEYFTALKNLYCMDNLLTELDLSSLTSLENVYCQNNQLTSINLGTISSLKVLVCNNNQLASLDVSNLIYLEELGYGANSNIGLNGNHLPHQDLPNPELLKLLNCDYSNLTELDVSSLVGLEDLDCKGNQLKTLDVTKNSSLQRLVCHDNQLSTLDVTKNTSLQYLNCGGGSTGNNLTELNVRQNTELTELYCESNQLTSLDVTQNKKLGILYCSNNQITDLDVSNNTELILIQADVNQLSEINLKNNTELSHLFVQYNQLKSLDVTQNTKLQGLQCTSNHLAELDLSNCTSLDSLTVDSQTIELGEPEATGDSSYTYRVSFSSLDIKDTSDFFSRMSDVSVTDYDGNDLNFITYMGTPGAWEFKGKPKTITYKYDTKRPDASDYMDVTITLAGEADTSGSVAIDTAVFPDANFRSYISEYGLDTNGNGYLDKNELESVTSLYVYGREISSLKGIEYFSNITYLDCSSNDLKELDITPLVALKTLNCWRNRLTELDLTHNDKLEHLNCNNNQLTALDVTNNTNLKYLDCRSNQLTELITRNTKLSNLYCGENQLTELDITQNAELYYLNCDYNKLTSLNVTQNSELRTLHCNGNQLTTLNVTQNSKLRALGCQNNQLTELDITQNAELYYLNCNYNELTSLDVTQNSELHTLHCDNNQLTTLDVTHNTSMDILYCRYNEITALYFASNDSLATLHCENNKLVTLDVTQNTNLQSLYCGNNQLTELKTQNANLQSLGCQNNQLVTLDVTQSTNLEYLDCENNQLTELITRNTKLSNLYCWENQLSTLDVTQDTNLEYLLCWNNQLTALDVTNNTKLSDLDCWSNDLKALDVTHNSELSHLGCGDNQIETLNVTQNAKLNYLSCYNNQLKGLDISQNSELYYLDLAHNQLTALDVKKNTNLQILRCRNNQLTTLDVSQNSNLRSLACGSNPLTELDLSKNNLTYLNVEYATSLQSLKCAGQQLTTLDLKTNTALQNLSCDTQAVTISQLRTMKNPSSYTHYLNLWNSRTELDYYYYSQISYYTSRIKDFTVKDSSGNNVSYYTDTSNGIIFFTSEPKTITYNYDVQYQADSSVLMDVTVTLELSDSPSWESDPIPSTPDPTPDPDPNAIALDSSNFPDSTFLAIITASFDADGNGYLSSTDIAAVTTLNLSGRGITSLKGIEHFSSLTYLDCSNNNLYELDVTYLYSLQTLLCQGNQLSELDVTNNESLQHLNCGQVLTGNNLTELDVTQNSELLVLYCESNQLTSLNVTKNTKLQTLECGWNDITDLNVASNDALSLLHASVNKLTKLDVTNNAEMTFLFFENNNVSEIDVTQNPKLQLLECSNNPLSELDVTKNTELRHLSCSGIGLTSLNVSKNTELQSLVCADNSLTELDVSNNHNLLGLLCENNKLEKLNVSDNPDLVILTCQNNNILSLDLSANTQLDSESDLENMSGEGSMYDYIYSDSRYRSSNYSTQDVNVPEAVSSDNTAYPYQFDMKTLAIDLGKVQSDFYVEDNDKNLVSYSFDVSSGIIYFGARPDVMTYQYEVQYQGSHNNMLSMAVHLLFGLTLYTDPSSLTFSSPSASAQEVEIIANLDNVTYTTSINPSTGLSATVSGNILTLTPSAEGTYTVTVTGTNGTYTETREISVTVSAGSSPVPVDPDPDPTPVSGITGISITSPSGKQITLPFIGGEFTATVTASGTAEGTITWTMNHDEGLSVNMTTSGDTAVLSGSAPANTTSDDVSYSVSISASDGNNTTFSDTLTVLVKTVEEMNGITGIALSSNTVNLEYTGGNFSVMASVAGIPSGDVVWSVSHDEGITAEIDGTGTSIAINGTAPENAGSEDIRYNVTVSAHDNNNVNFNSSFTVDVSPYREPEIEYGITGISLSQSSITLESNGGEFSVTASVRGNPSGDITWNVNSDIAEISGSGSSVTVSGNAPENTTTNAIGYTVRITAQDSIRSADTSFTVTVKNKGRSDPNNPDDPDNPYDPYDDPETNGNSEATAYRILSARVFALVISQINSGNDPAGKYYRLDDDIDLTGTDFQPIGSGSPFMGHFIGNGKTITYSHPLGLFGTISSDGIAVQNLNVVAVSPVVNSVRASVESESEPSQPAGGIVSELMSGTIDNCTFSGNVTAPSDDNNASAGGIAGSISGGTIRNCRVLEGSTIYASSYAGGIAGYVSGGTISGCTSNASVSSDETEGYTGGIAGYSEDEIRRNIANNTFTGTELEVGNDDDNPPVPPNPPESDDTGITGIAITSPDSDTLSLSSLGGSFDFIVTASGTPSGDIVWALSFDSEITARVSSRTSNTVVVSGNAPANSNTFSKIYNVIVSAHDNKNIDFTDSITIEVARARNQIDPIQPIDLPSSVRRGILSRFSGITEAELHYFNASELFYNWDVNDNDLNTIDGMNEQITLKLPRMTPTNTGVYIMRCTLSEATSGVKLKFYGITDENGGNLSAANLDRNIEYKFFDEEGNEIDTVPEDKIVYVAMRLNAGTTRGGVLTVPKELKIGTITPVDPEELGDIVLERIADTMSLDVSEIKFITEDNITSPDEPSETLKQEARRRNLEFVGKMDTITVNENGNYILRVTLSNELFEQIKGMRVRDLRVHALDNTDNADPNASVRQAILPIYGFLNTWELFTLTGNEMEFTAQTFLMVGLLQAGEPLTLYILKTLLLLLGGCDVGFGVGGIAVLAFGMIAIKTFRKNRKH